MSITEHGIRTLAESAPKLTSFKAEGCAYVIRFSNLISSKQQKKISVQMTTNAALELAKHCPNLLYLDFNRCVVRNRFRMMLRQWFVLVVDWWWNLMSRKRLSSVRNNYSRELYESNWSNIDFIGEIFSSIKKTRCYSMFTIYRCRIFSFIESKMQTNEKRKRTFSFQGCHLLEKIDLEDCTAVTDETLRHLTDNCPNIQILVNHREFNKTKKKANDLFIWN